jgi:hypothetical protein
MKYSKKRTYRDGKTVTEEIIIKKTVKKNKKTSFKEKIKNFFKFLNF